MTPFCSLTALCQPKFEIIAHCEKFRGNWESNFCNEAEQAPVAKTEQEKESLTFRFLFAYYLCAANGNFAKEERYDHWTIAAAGI